MSKFGNFLDSSSHSSTQKELVTHQTKQHPFTCTLYCLVLAKFWFWWCQNLVGIIFCIKLNISPTVYLFDSQNWFWEILVKKNSSNSSPTLLPEPSFGVPFSRFLALFICGRAFSQKSLQISYSCLSPPIPTCRR